MSPSRNEPGIPEKPEHHQDDKQDKNCGFVEGDWSERVILLVKYMAYLLVPSASPVKFAKKTLISC